MIGSLPAAVRRYRIDGERTVESAEAPRAPGAGEVTVAVAGSALGAVPGLEVAGVVVAAGEAAEEWLGRRVVVPRSLPCGECERCRRGRTAACLAPAARAGAFVTASHAPFQAPSHAPSQAAGMRGAGRPGSGLGDVLSHETVPSRYLLSVEPPLWPEGVELAWLAALADAAAFPYGAIVRGQVAPGDLCAIVGAGVRGRFAAAIVKAKGAHAVVVDGDARRREAAMDAGARAVIDDAALDAAGLRGRLRGIGEELGLGTVELKVIEATSGAAGRARAVALCAEGGTAVLLGDGDAVDWPLELASLVEHEGTILGAAACHPDLYPELMALVVRGELSLAREVHLRPFTDYAAALKEVREGRLSTLPILVPASPGH